MPTECSATLFEFAPVEGRARGGRLRRRGDHLERRRAAARRDRPGHRAGRRFAACFRDARSPERVEHEVATLVGQRVFGIALGHEDLVDHDQLRHDPVLAVLLGKLEARHRPLRAAGRQEHAEPAGARAAASRPLPPHRP